MAWKVKGPTNLLQSIVVANYNTLMEFVRRLSEVTRRVVVGDWRLNNLSGSQVGEFFTHAAHQIPLRCVTAAFKAFSANNHDYNDNHINSTSLTMIAKSLSYRCTADFVPLFKRVTKPSDFLPEFYFRLARSFIIHVDCAHSLSIFSREHTISCPMRTLHNPFCRLYTLFDFFCGLRLLHDHVNYARPVVPLISCAPQSLSSSARASWSLFRITHVPWSLVPPEHNCLSLSSVLARWSSLSAAHAPFTSYVASARSLAFFIEYARSLISHVDSAYSFTSLLHALCDVFCRVHTAPWSILSTAHAH